MALNNDLERNMGMLFYAIDSDPHFSELDRKTQRELKRELMEEVIDENSGILTRFLKEAILKNPVIQEGNFYIEPLQLPLEDEYMKIEKIIREEFKNIDAQNFDPDEELMERVAFNLIGRDYVKFGKEREDLFLNDEDMYADFVDAYMKASSVYDDSSDRFTRDAKPPTSSTPATQPEVDVPYFPEAEEAEQPGFIERNKTWIGGLIAALFVGGVAYRIHNDRMNKIKAEQQKIDQRIGQLVDSGAITDENEATEFDTRYNGWANNNVYNQSVLNFASLWDNNQTLANMIGAHATGPNGSVWRVTDYIQAHPGAAVSTPGQWRSFAMLLSSVEGIGEHPILLAGGAEQADRLLYGRKLAGSTQESADYAWNSFTIPAIQFEVDLINNGNFTVDDLTREEAGRLLLPSTFVYLDIKNEVPPCYDINKGVKNFTPDDELGGDTPREWFQKTVLDIWNENGARREAANHQGINAYANQWPYSLKAHQEKANELMTEDEVAVFIYGNAGLHLPLPGPNGTRIEPIINMRGVDITDYKVLVGQVFGRVVIPYWAPYPSGSGNAHSESFVRTENGDYLGLWEDDFVSDYFDSPIEPKLMKQTPDGEYVQVSLENGE